MEKRQREIAVAKAKARDLAKIFTDIRTKLKINVSSYQVSVGWYPLAGDC